MITAGQLSKETWTFVFQNLNSLKNHLMPIIPSILFLGFVGILGESYELAWVQYLSYLIGLYFLGCFTLSWYRFSLMGDQENRPLNPFKVTIDDVSFLIVFALLYLTTFLIFSLPGFISDSAQSVFQDQSGMVLLIKIAHFVSFLVLFWATLRFYFLLPAKSINVNLKISDTKLITKGLTTKIFLIIILYAFLMGFIATLYSAIALFILASIVGLEGLEDNLKTLSTDTIFFIITLPTYAVYFIFAALNVTLISRAYQWGMQNNR